MVGWREWVAIPALMLPVIKAKIDSGARTSALHAFYLEPRTVKGIERIRFGVHPVQRRKDIVVHCDADVLDRRIVSNSGGHREMRFTIKVEIARAGTTWPRIPGALRVREILAGADNPSPVGPVTKR